MPNIIAFDGPAASGKSTIAYQLSKSMGYLFFDTGVMYRAVTWKVLNDGVPVEDEAGVTRVAEEVLIEVQPASQDDNRTNDVLVNGQDVTWEIRKAEVEEHVSAVSAYPGVRKAMTAQQRRIGLAGKVIMVGRDIGTVVLPEADLKIFLEASVEERARRRYQELVDRGEKADLSEILEAMRRRDKVDSSRKVAPLRAAEDAVRINSDGLTIPEVLQKISSLIQP
ncbi:MAG TPA: (d)CMP kinase [Anaerolineaceae bacterium]|nr:(d)CMP kinase [Anaerolineaceae bacterium]HPN50203.1 (d)CMP kinase [Anaerolineaceae bacterium]